jgi:uncharacterized membrane protein
MRNFFNKNLLKYDFNALFENLLLIVMIGFAISGFIGIFVSDNAFSLVKSCCIIAFTMPMIISMRGGDV